MTWMSWRQLRGSAAAAGAVLVAVVVTLLVTGVHLNHEFSDYRSCSAFNCDALFQRVRLAYPHVQLIGSLLIFGPVLFGVFWGAPLVARELESGTYRLAWTQGVSRTRWFASRAAVGASAVILASGLLAFAFTWWSKPFDLTGTTRISPPTFDQRGIVPIAYALFAFGLGVALGALFRRTLPAMAGSIVGFVGVRMIVQYFVRPHLLTPLSKVAALSSTRIPFDFTRMPGTGLHLTVHEASVPNAWTVGTKLVDSSGHAPSAAYLSHACSAMLNVPPPAGSGVGPKVGPTPQMQAAVNSCIDNIAQRYHLVVSYLPESRFWALQWVESAIFVGLAGLLVALSVYWVRRRLV